MDRTSDVSESTGGEETASNSGRASRLPSRADLALVRRSRLERVLDVVRELGSADDATHLLRRIARAIIDVVEFDAVAVNVTTGHGDLRVEVVDGPPETAVLLGTSNPVDAWERIFAVAERWGALYFRHGIDFAHEELRSWVPEPSVQSLLAPEEDRSVWRPDYELYAPLRGDDGELLGVLSVDLPHSGTVPDLEQRTILELFAAQAAAVLSQRASRTEARDREMLYRNVFAEAPAAIAILDNTLTVIDANAQLAVLRGVALDALFGPFDDVLGTLGEPGRLAGHARAILEGEAVPSTIDLQFRRSDGVLRWARAAMRRVESERLGMRVICTLDDITSDHEALEEQRRDARHDSLTGLLNRRGGDLRLEEAIAGVPQGYEIALLACDLDGFKAVNDQLGHQAGDELLVAVAGRLAGTARAADAVCRYGGDEFVVIATVLDRDEASALAQRCIDAIGGPFQLGRGKSSVTLSIGVAVSGGRRGPIEPGEMHATADKALYEAKRLGKARWTVASIPRVPRI